MHCLSKNMSRKGWGDPSLTTEGIVGFSWVDIRHDLHICGEYITPTMYRKYLFDTSYDSKRT